MAIITPTIGRVVLARLANMNLTDPNAQDFPALISYVFPVAEGQPQKINIAGFDSNGDPFKATSLQLIDAGQPLPTDGSSYAYWMPYQITAATKPPAENKPSATPFTEPTLSEVAIVTSQHNATA